MLVLESLFIFFKGGTQMSACPICTGLGFWFFLSDRAHFLLSKATKSVWNAVWIFYCLFTQRNKDARQTHVPAPHKYMPECFFSGFTSKCLKNFSSIIWKCIFLNYSSRGIEAPRSFKFFISAQLQTVDLVKGTQFWGVGIAAGRSWQDFQSRGTPRFFITAKQREQIQVN